MRSSGSRSKCLPYNGFGNRGNVIPFIPGYVAFRIEEWLNPQDQPPEGYIILLYPGLDLSQQHLR